MKKTLKISIFLLVLVFAFSCSSSKSGSKDYSEGMPSWFSNSSWQGVMSQLYAYYDNMAYTSSSVLTIDKGTDLFDYVLKSLEINNQNVVSINEEQSYIVSNNSKIKVYVVATVQLDGKNMSETVTLEVTKKGSKTAVFDSVVKYYVSGLNEPYVTGYEKGEIKKK